MMHGDVFMTMSPIKRLIYSFLIKSPFNIIYQRQKLADHAPISIDIFHILFTFYSHSIYQKLSA